MDSKSRCCSHLLLSLFAKKMCWKNKKRQLIQTSTCSPAYIYACVLRTSVCYHYSTSRFLPGSPGVSSPRLGPTSELCSVWRWTPHNDSKWWLWRKARQQRRAETDANVNGTALLPSVQQRARWAAANPQPHNLPPSSPTQGAHGSFFTNLFLFQIMVLLSSQKVWLELKLALCVSAERQEEYSGIGHWQRVFSRIVFQKQLHFQRLIAFPGFWGNVFGCWTPSKKDVLVHKNSLASCERCRHSVEHCEWREVHRLWNLCYVCWRTLFLMNCFGIELVFCDLYLTRFELTKGFLFDTFLITVGNKIVSLWSLSIGFQIIFTTNQFVDRTNYLQSDAPQIDTHTHTHTHVHARTIWKLRVYTYVA